jgi:hypothetical protein
MPENPRFHCLRQAWNRGRKTVNGKRITVTQGLRGWLIPEQKPTRELPSSDRRPMTWRAIRYALNHLVDEGVASGRPRSIISKSTLEPRRSRSTRLWKSLVKELSQKTDPDARASQVHHLLPRLRPHQAKGQGIPISQLRLAHEARKEVRRNSRMHRADRPATNLAQHQPTKTKAAVFHRRRP